MARHGRLHMDLYFSPLAGSLAARIALYEAGADARFIEVDSETKRTSDGSDFAEIYPLGLVPLLRLDDGSLLTAAMPRRPSVSMPGRAI
jgi:glutathione S-transferase